MNKGGQVALVGLMIGIMVILIGIIVLSPLSEVMDTQRGAANMDCDNSSISDGAKMGCLVLDITPTYFLVIVIAAAGAFITAKYFAG